jgi:hypothetical protein
MLALAESSAMVPIYCAPACSCSPGKLPRVSQLRTGLHIGRTDGVPLTAAAAWVISEPMTITPPSGSDRA